MPGTLPYSIVENTGFCKLLTVTASCYGILSCMHFSHTVVPNLYSDVKAKVKKSLLSMEGNVVHCTADIWTSMCCFKLSVYVQEKLKLVTIPTIIIICTQQHS